MSGLTIISGPPGSGKTERLVARAAQRVEADRFASTLVLVPTARHGDQFRRRVVERCGVALNLEVTTLNLFARRIAAGGSVLPADVATELLQRAARREIEAGGAARFAPVADTPGLHALVRQAVDELIGSDVSAPDLAEAARRAGSVDHEALAAVYGAYRRALDERSWRDPRETPTLAAEAVEEGRDLPALVLVDSFEFLNPRELALVAALARHTDVALTLDREGSERSGWTASRLDALVPGSTHEELAARPLTAGVEARSAFDAEAQIREIARAIKQTLARDASLRPSDFAVVFRQATPHLTLARRVFTEYELPFDPAAGERLASRPFGTWVLGLLRLPAHEWRLTRVAALLRSSFLDRSVWSIDGDTVDHALRVGRRRGLFAGLDSLRRLPAALLREAGEQAERGNDGYAARLRAASGAVERVAGGLEGLLGGEPLPPGVWATALDAALFGADSLVPAAVDGYESLDVEAAALRSSLDALRAIDERLGATPVTLDQFADELEARMQRPGTLLREAGGVLFAPMHTLHGLRFAHVFVGGLTEGEFPAPRRTGALLDRRGRDVLHAGGLELPPEPRAAEDELWATVSSRADTSTSLWRPRFDERGRPRATSWYWQDAASPAVDEPAGVLPEASASLRELAVSLSSLWREEERRRPRDLDAWPLVVRAAPIEQLRRSFAAAGRHEGDLRGIAAQSAVERLTGESARWSASRLESYRTCSFQFFGRYGLQLYEVEDEHVEADAATRGTVVHEILEAALQPLEAAGRPLLPDTLGEAVARVRDEGRRLWESAPVRHAFGRAELWRFDWETTVEEIVGLLKREAEENARLGVERVAGLELQIDTTMPGVEPAMHLTGQIDRADAGPGFVQIVDYKTGRDIRKKDVDEGRRLQLQLYAIAAREQLGAERLVARYAYTRPPRSEWALDTSDAADAEVINRVAAQAGEVRRDIEGGDFRVNPQVPCPRWCDFRHVCRVNQFTRWKQ
ncbi:MAG: PD-(D/E)XK nuclease family protein [Chloroflexi bacterium]|nr:PD-(D/E)XK nuclease family protein [Chloroflexota bacterium]